MLQSGNSFWFHMKNTDISHPFTFSHDSWELLSVVEMNLLKWSCWVLQCTSTAKKWAQAQSWSIENVKNRNEYEDIDEHTLIAQFASTPYARDSDWSKWNVDAFVTWQLEWCRVRSWVCDEFKRNDWEMNSTKWILI